MNKVLFLSIFEAKWSFRKSHERSFFGFLQEIWRYGVDQSLKHQWNKKSHSFGQNSGVSLPPLYKWRKTYLVIQQVLRGWRSDLLLISHYESGDNVSGKVRRDETRSEQDAQCRTTHRGREVIHSSLPHHGYGSSAHGRMESAWHTYNWVYLGYMNYRAYRGFGLVKFAFGWLAYMPSDSSKPGCCFFMSMWNGDVYGYDSLNFLVLGNECD